MQLLESAQQLSDILARHKSKHLTQYSNGFFTPAELNKNTATKRLSYIETTSCILLFLDQDTFYRAYYFMFLDKILIDSGVTLPENELAELRASLATIEKPMIVEFSYRHAKPQKVQDIIPLVKQLGFNVYRKNLRYQIDLDSFVATRTKDHLIQKGLLACEAQPEHVDAILALWKSNMEPYQTYILSTEELLDSIEKGYVVIALDKDKVCGALLRRHHGPTTTLGPVATNPIYRGNGIAQVLYCESLLAAKANGVRRSVAWMEENNQASIALHESIGYSFDGNIIESFFLAN